MKSVLVKSLFSVLVCGMLSSSAMARTWDSSACGGTIEIPSDCRGNSRAWGVTCCPDGYTAAGVAYNDIDGQDHTDAVGIVCRSKSGTLETEGADFGTAPSKYTCSKSEKLVGIYTKDVLTNEGKFRDTLDGLTAICQAGKNSEYERVIDNSDIRGGREGTRHVVYGGRKVVGIAYKELENGKSDRADCAAIITK